MELTTTQKRQRLLTMIFGAVAIFFTGYPHVWSIYQPYVMEQAGWSQTAASMCFYLALSTFVFGNIIGENSILDTDIKISSIYDLDQIFGGA